MKCVNCKFWYQPEGNKHEKVSDIVKRIGQCRKNAPTGLDSRSRWPIAMATDWCGEFTKSFEDTLEDIATLTQGENYSDTKNA